MNRHYSYTSCTPSRGALFSGRLPVHFGTILGEPYTWDGGVNKSWGYNGIPPNFTTLATKLKMDAGYKTHLVGKADGLGMATPQHVPLGRGFDSWVGYYNHANDMWDYSIGMSSTAAPPPCLLNRKIYDLYGPGDHGYYLSDTDANVQNLQSSTGKGVYEEDIFLQRALKVVEEHNPSEPLLLMYTSHNPHTPLQAPAREIEQMSSDMCEYNPHCKDSSGACSLLTGKSSVGVCRQYDAVILLAMVQHLDSSVGAIVDKLKDKDMWKDTLLVFASDNGAGTPQGVQGNNYPLNGAKGGIWEGGFRTPALVSGGFLPAKARGTVSDAVMHIADWYATFLSILSIPLRDRQAEEVGLPQPDSINFWPTIAFGLPADPRDELQLDPHALLVKQDTGSWLKLLTGTITFTMWTGPDFPNSTCVGVLKATRTGCMASALAAAPWALTQPYDCGSVGCLYDVTNDEGEHNNLNATHPRKLEELAERLKVLNIPGSLPGNPGYIEPWQGCQSPVVNVMCDVSINNLGGHYGPFLNVDNCSQCVHTTQGYLQECAAGRATSNGELCVPPTSNECQCYTTLKDCQSDESCQWRGGFLSGKCDLSEGALGSTYAERQFEKLPFHLARSASV